MQQTCSGRLRSCSRSEHVKRPYKGVVTAGHLTCWLGGAAASGTAAACCAGNALRGSGQRPGMLEMRVGSLCTRLCPFPTHAQCPPKRLQLYLWVILHRHEQLEAAQASSLQGTEQACPLLCLGTCRCSGVHGQASCHMLTAAPVASLAVPACCTAGASRSCICWGFWPEHQAFHCGLVLL